MRHRLHSLYLLLAAFHLPGCSPEVSNAASSTSTTSTTSTTSSTSSGSSGSTGMDNPCPPGQAVDAQGACFTVGLPACADIFRRKDGLCQPSADFCAPYELPIATQGCVPTGVVQCAAEHLNADKLCQPERAHCADGFLPTPSGGCIPLDGPDGCGVGPYGNVPDEPGNVYVDASAVPGGDGSHDKPFATIAEALAVVQAGGRVVLAAGTYNESNTVKLPIEIRGRCASMTHVQGTTKLIVGAFFVLSGNVTFRDFSVSGPYAAFWVKEAPSITLERIHIQNAGECGVYANGANSSVSLHHVLIDETKTSEAASFGAIYLSTGAQATISSSAIVNNHCGSVVAVTGSKLDVSDTFIADNRDDLPGAINAGVFLFGSTATLDNIVISRSSDLGVDLLQSTATITNSVIADTRPTPGSPNTGIGIYADVDSHVSMASTIVTASQLMGIGAMSGSSITAEKSIIQGTESNATTKQFGFGAGIIDSQLDMKECLLTDNHSSGIAAQGVTTRVTVEDSVIEKTRAQAVDGLFGRGVQTSDRATASLTRVAISQNRDIGAAAVGASVLSLDECIVTDTLPREVNGEFGMGVAADGNSTCNVARTRIERSRVGGIFAAGANANISQVWIHEVLPGKFTLANTGTTFDNVGDGILATKGAYVAIDRMLAEKTSRAGILFDVSVGTLTNSVSRNNRFGLVLQGDVQPSYDLFTLVLEPSTEQALVKSGDLTVPDSSPNMPSPPKPTQ